MHKRWSESISERLNIETCKVLLLALNLPEIGTDSTR